MWYLTKPLYERFLYAHALTLPQSDKEWADILAMFLQENISAEQHFQLELAECKNELLSILPDRFKPYIYDGTLNQPTLAKEVREDFHLWQQQELALFQSALKKAKDHFQTIQPELPKCIATLFQHNMSGAQIIHITRQDNHMQLLLNTEFCEIPQTKVALSFKHILKEEGSAPLKKDQYVLFHELKKNNESIALRLITHPNEMWTIEAKTMGVWHSQNSHTI